MRFFAESLLPPGGRAPYWRGRITSLAYEFATGGGEP
jgi:hypothetical protein